MNSILRNPLLFPVYIPHFLLALCSGLIIPILPLYAKSFEVSYSFVGIVLAADGLGRLLGDIPAAIFLNRLGRKLAMVLGVGTVAICGAALFIAPSIYAVFILRLIGGAGGSLWNISRYAYLTDITSPHQRGRTISVFGGVSRIGTFVGPAAGGIIAASTSLQTPFLLFGGIAAIATLIAAIAIEDGHTALPRPPGGHLRYIASVFKNHRRSLLTAGTGQLFAQAIRSGRSIIVPLYGAEVLGLGYEQVGLILSIAGLIDMSLFYPAGLIMDRFGRKFAIVPSFTLQAIGMAFIPLTLEFATLLNSTGLILFANGLFPTITGAFISLMLATCLIGFGNGLSSGAMMTFGADLAPREGMSEFLSLWRLIGDGGHLGGPLAIGSIADILGLSPAAFVIAGIGLSAAGIFLFVVPETLQRPKKSSSQ